jgi:hypothetical protein
VPPHEPGGTTVSGVRVFRLFVRTRFGDRAASGATFGDQQPNAASPSNGCVRRGDTEKIQMEPDITECCIDIWTILTMTDSQTILIQYSCEFKYQSTGNASIDNYIGDGSLTGQINPRSQKKKAIVARARKDFKTDTCVSCPACSCEIRLPSALPLPGQFSVPCPNCGQRRNYESAQVHDRKDAEATHTRRRIQFGRKKIYIQSKSWLNECASWLLQ